MTFSDFEGNNFLIFKLFYFEDPLTLTLFNF